ncbi:DUF1338 domain-containing protein [Spongiimicrobium salis]|uniref:DUF1338 domain-containing protein n=1 Tax=Spongiimicrobium salis TaxID=1667022 RepID=UPI00374D9310
MNYDPLYFRSEEIGYKIQQVMGITDLKVVMDAIFQPYKNRVPNVNKVSDAMIAEGIIAHEMEINNDHIAFRTLGVPHLGLASLEKIFLHYGYEKRDAYSFEEKKLNAHWYAPPEERYPRIFISELRVEDFSERTQGIVKKYTRNIKADPVDQLDFSKPEEVGAFFHKPLWELPTKADYMALLKESEYAAWVIYNRYYLNHYTISVHDLPKEYNTLEQFNTFLETIGLVLNTSGGKIKTSPDGLLKQSSSVAEMVEAEFAQGEKMKIAGSYVEFAERLPLLQYKDLPRETIQRKHRRDGFESGNADKIFESTYSEQTQNV